jgi:predicted nucleic acid-binding protein
VDKREAGRQVFPVHGRCDRESLLFHRRESAVHFRVRPFLPDSGDKFLLELAVAGVADAIVTHNVRRFPGVEQLGVRVLTPREFLRKIEVERI